MPYDSNTFLLIKKIDGLKKALIKKNVITENNIKSEM